MRRELSDEDFYLQLWAHAVYQLRLSSDEFGRLTPRQFDLLCEQHKCATRRQEVLFATVASTVANSSMLRGAEPAQIRDYMPSEWKPTRTQTRRAAQEELRLKLVAMRRQVNGAARHARCGFRSQHDASLA